MPDQLDALVWKIARDSPRWVAAAKEKLASHPKEPRYIILLGLLVDSANMPASDPYSNLATLMLTLAKHHPEWLRELAESIPDDELGRSYQLVAKAVAQLPIKDTEDA